MSYYSDKVNACGRDTKGIFRITKHLLGDTDAPTLPNGSPKELAQNFSNFFIQKIVSIRNDLQSSTNPLVQLPDTHTDVSEPLVAFVPTSQEEVTAIIKRSPDKSCELDPLPTWLLKHCLDELLPLVTNIINTSMEASYVPRDFKCARIRPLLKKPGLDPDTLKHNRPVSNLPFISKILEKVVDSRLERHLVTNSLHEVSQSAYRKFHSTETALLKVQNDILQSLDQGCVSVLILLDLSAAFDTIDHQTLLRRLEHCFGIYGKPLAWMTSYLTDRYQTVCVGDELSEPVLMENSVPQGCVLGPKNYIMYTKPLGDIIRTHGLHHHFYADDTQLYLSFKPKDDVAQCEALTRIENCLKYIESWMHQNMLKLNADKTEVMLFSSKHNSRTMDTISVDMGNSSIASTSCVRNLGVMFDSNMTMEQQVNAVCRSSYGQLRKIGRIRRYLSSGATKSLVNGLVTSHMDYCNALLHVLPNALIDKLQRVQNTAARIITRTSRHSHITPVLRKLHWLPIQYRILVHTYNALNDRSPLYITDMLNIYRPSRTLRSQNTLTLV